MSWLLLLAAAQATQWPTAAWPTSSLEARDLHPEPLAALHADIEAGAYGYVDRLVVIHEGYRVINARYRHDYARISRGWDSMPHQYNYYHPDWHPYVRGRDVHTLQSVTKSITSTLIGIAIGRGEIPGVEASLVSYLAGYDLTRTDPRLAQVTLDDLLAMRSGIEWHETDRPFNETNTTLQLEASVDWVQFVLDQPMDADPGTKWVYNSGGSHLMSAVVREATGMTVDAYAERFLFGPLGIREYHWKRTPTGLPDTEGGLYLEADDLAKIGYLYLHDGVWNGQRILPTGWVAASTARRVERVNQADWGYGYQWWRLDRGGTPVWAGLGFGGQYLLVLPEYAAVGVINSWNVFGGSPPPLLPAFLDALLATVGHQ